MLAGGHGAALSASVVCGLMLCGCFSAREKLIAAESASYPFQRADYVDDLGKTRSMLREGDHYALYVEGAKLEPEYMLHAVGQDTFLVQASGEGGLWAYGILRVRGHAVDQLECRNFAADQLQSLNVKVEDDVCAVTSIDQLLALAKLKPKGVEPSVHYNISKLQ